MVGKVVQLDSAAEDAETEAMYILNRLYFRPCVSDVREKADRASSPHPHGHMLFAGPHPQIATRHSNIVQLHHLIRSKEALHVLFKYEEYSLKGALACNFSSLKDNNNLNEYSCEESIGELQQRAADDSHGDPQSLALNSGDSKVLFVAYQLFQALSYIHSVGLCHGNVVPRNVLMSSRTWVYLSGFAFCGQNGTEAGRPLTPPIQKNDRESKADGASILAPSPVPRAILDSALAHWGGSEDSASIAKVGVQSSGPRHMDAFAPMDPTVADRAEDLSLEHLTVRWCNRQVSNFEYLMALNEAAGRKMGDSTYHPVLPWVSDFHRQGSGWRDFSKSKFRLKKGDKQLDETYSYQQPPHHITENLSDITYYTYMARRTPIQVLKQIVRPKFEPQEYPQNVAGMYEFSPDECIPEFFVDPHSFASLHEGMEDLEIPAWCTSHAQFCEEHMRIIESDIVSQNLHSWIDLNFGHLLSGSEAIEAKNVTLSSQSHWSNKLNNSVLTTSVTFVQLFHSPHPPRLGSGSPGSHLEGHLASDQHFLISGARTAQLSQIDNNAHHKACFEAMKVVTRLGHPATENIGSLFPVKNDTATTVGKQGLQTMSSSHHRRNRTQVVGDFDAPRMSAGDELLNTLGVTMPPRANTYAAPRAESQFSFDLADLKPKAVRQASKGLAGVSHPSCERANTFSGLSDVDPGHSQNSNLAPPVKGRDRGDWGGLMRYLPVISLPKSVTAAEVTDPVGSIESTYKLSGVSTRLDPCYFPYGEAPSQASDVFSAACIFVELFLQKPLFSRRSMKQYMTAYWRRAGEAGSGAPLIYREEGITGTSPPQGSTQSPLSCTPDHTGNGSVQSPDGTQWATTSGCGGDTYGTSNNVAPFLPEQALPQLLSLPSQVLSTVNAALHPDPSFRPSASEVLGVTSLSNNGMFRSASMENMVQQDHRGGGASKSEQSQPRATAATTPAERTSPFPESFSSIHGFLSTLMALHFESETTWAKMIECIHEHLLQMVGLPDSCFQVLTCHILDVFVGRSPFEPSPFPASSNLSADLFSADENAQHKAALAFTSLFHIMAPKLGPSKTQTILLSPLVKLFESAKVPKTIALLLESNFLKSVLRSAGPENFITLILPRLLEWTLEEGRSSPRRRRSGGSDDTAPHPVVGRESPAAGDTGTGDLNVKPHTEEHEPLLHQVAALSMARCGDPAMLGPALATRYVLPPLLEHFCRKFSPSAATAPSTSLAGKDGNASPSPSSERGEARVRERRGGGDRETERGVRRRGKIETFLPFVSLVPFSS
jgi:serine/threonine protein kinase